MKEVCFNLWYYLDRNQNIVAIAARAYVLDGSDDEKGAALLEASCVDYVSELRREIGPVHYSMLQQVGVEHFFAREFQRIQNELPRGLVLPEEKLFWATPLYDFGEGYVPAEIGDGFIRERH